MKKIINHRQFFATITLVLSLFVISSFSSVNATTTKDLSLSSAVRVKVDPSDFVFTDENGNALDSSDFDVIITSNESMITPYANIISKTMTVTKQNYGSPYLASYIYVSELSGYLTPWTGTLPLVNSYTVEFSGGTMYYSVYSGTVYASIR